MLVIYHVWVVGVCRPYTSFSSVIFVSDSNNNFHFDKTHESWTEAPARLATPISDLRLSSNSEGKCKLGVDFVSLLSQEEEEEEEEEEQP